MKWIGDFIVIATLLNMLSIQINTALTVALTLLSLYSTADTVPEFPAELLASKKHNSKLFTQGLFLDKGIFYESSGLYGQSQLLHYSDRETLASAIDTKLFAEGLTVIDDTVYMLTWKAQQLLSFNKHTLQQGKTLGYRGEGWGLSHNQQHFIMSNGSNRLTFHNQQSFALEKTLTVKGLDRLNELEYIDGVIWANRWHDDYIYAIDSKSGCILGKINLTTLRQQAVSALNNKNVTNGIAYDADKNGLWVTGKYWGEMFLIKRPTLPVPDC
ncbi:MAG: glutaminyl-peptide cyclotransferase [Cellvibrionaceae bacterium]|nr:glutaminyl-peptide cyclotransferase [Cellvibrionaceae bacterium]